MSDTASLAVFASGSGSNLQALLDRFGRDGAPDPAARIVLVVSDRPGIRALERAAAAGVPGVVVSPRDFADSATFGEALLAALRGHGADLVALAGYLRLVPAAVVAEFRGRMVNIHPGPLPTFGGPGMYGGRVHRAVIESGLRVSGPTVHFVDERYDTGPIIAQWPVPVLPEDTPDSLAARVLRYEHRLYPVVVRAVARGDVVMEADGRVRFATPPPAGAIGFAATDEGTSLESVEFFWQRGR